MWTLPFFLRLNRGGGTACTGTPLHPDGLRPPDPLHSGGLRPPTPPCIPGGCAPGPPAFWGGYAPPGTQKTLRASLLRRLKTLKQERSPGFNVQDSADLPLATLMDSWVPGILDSGSTDPKTLFCTNGAKLEIVAL